MQIVIRTTTSDPPYAREISVTVPYDDHDIDSLVDNVLRPLLLAFGFAEETVNSRLSQQE